MKRLLLAIAFLCVSVQAQVTTQNARRLPSGSGAPTVACVAGPPFIQYYTDTSTSPPTIYTCKSGTWTATAGGAASAPIGATYITQTPNAALTNEQALSLLATGIPLITTTTGVISISSVTNDAQTKAAIVPNTAPSAGQILAGNAGGTAYAPVSMSGDATLGSTGAITLASTITAGGPTGSATVAPIITYDAKGRLTTVTSATITPAVGSITGLGTGVATALAVNVGSAGAFITFNGAGGTPSALVGTNITGLPTTGLTGTLQAAQEPAHTGDVTNSAGSLALSIAANAVTLAKLATQATNTILGNATSGSAVPTALTIGSCSTSGSALIWTTNTGFGCNTSIAANTATTATDTASKTGTGSTYVTNTSPQLDKIGLGTAAVSNFGITSTLNLAVSGTNSLQAYGVGVPGCTNCEYIDIFHNGASNAFFIVNKSGSGSYRALDIRTGGTQTMLLGTDQSVTFPGAIKYTGITTDATHTDSTVCQDTTTHQLYSGSGAAGICLGTSSERFKNSIRDLGEGLNELVRLRPRTFFYNKNQGDGGAHLQYGFIAEEMKGVLPGLVRSDADGNPQSIDYGGLWPVIVKAIQDLNTKVERLENEKTSIRHSVRRHHHARAN